jgi:hypothetical protein
MEHTKNEKFGNLKRYPWPILKIIQRGSKKLLQNRLGKY